MPASDVQVVVLAGGLGTRLGGAGLGRPKILQPVDGTPFLDIQLNLMLGHGFRRFCFCLGHLADHVIAHVGRRWPAVTASFHVDESPAGTGGSLAAARPLLEDEVLVVMGDTYLDIDFDDLLSRLRSPALGVMAVTNAATDVPPNVQISGNEVANYDKASSLPTSWVDTGALAIRRQALDLLIDVPPPSDLASLFTRMIRQRTLLAYPVSCPFYDIGSPERLERFAGFWRTAQRS